MQQEKNQIREEEIIQVQNEWGQNIVKIGNLFKNQHDYKTAAVSFLNKTYGYNEGTVLFKPTLASKYQFRLTKESALSYFIGGNSNFPRDTGFALQKWSGVRFENAGILITGQNAITMGNYYFSNADGKQTKVEYTIGFFRTTQGDLKINIHHSSLPYNPNIEA